MKDDVECPYCGEFQEINHDDGYGYEEDTVHNQECSDCGKVFGYNTIISFDYRTFETPCLNEGGEHNLVDVRCIPKEVGVGKKRCTYCDEEIIVDKESNQKAIKDYFEKLKGQ